MDERLLARTDSNVRHGEAMTCVYTAETAACRKAKIDQGLPAGDAPDESESGLRRGIVYDHPHLIDAFKARVKARDCAPAALTALAGERDDLRSQLTVVKDELAANAAPPARCASSSPSCPSNWTRPSKNSKPAPT